MSDDLVSRLDLAAEMLRRADALLIGAGAGMGVDSGLPDFRGNEGFWKAYPPFHGKVFAEISTPHWFRTDSQQAWGFFGHRLHLYRDTKPHAGFQILRKWAPRFAGGQFVFTSNVDGHFQRAGFAEKQVVECHGSIHYLQCTTECLGDLWPADETNIAVDDATIRASGELPRCPHCQQLARPNILMFGDGQWQDGRTSAQMDRYEAWLNRCLGKRVVAIEFGAGLAIPTVRRECQSRGLGLIRVNPREAEVPPGGISLPMGALEALEALDARLA